MNAILWILQILMALLYTASGVMKAFMFDQASEGVQSFGALPRTVWQGLGLFELACVVALIVPSALRWNPSLSVMAAAVLAAESLLFIWVHMQYREVPAIIMCAVLGAVMAFIAYGRAVLHPIRV